MTYTAGPTLQGRGRVIEGGDWKVDQFFKHHTDSFLYFAYGSCMDNRRDEGAARFFKTAVGAGVLCGYILKFTHRRPDGGRADFVEDPTMKVDGKVYRLPLSAKTYLYHREGVPSAYRPAIVNVTVNGVAQEMLTFIVVEKHPETAPPDWYAEEILRGATHWVSNEYKHWLVEKLARLISYA